MQCFINILTQTVYTNGVEFDSLLLEEFSNVTKLLVVIAVLVILCSTCVTTQRPE